MSWKVPRIWADKTVYIIGGGPSVVGLDMCLQPRDGRYGLEAYLHDKLVIGVNDAFDLGDYVSVLFFGDTRWYWARKEQVQRFKGLKITCNRGTKWGKGHESVVREPGINTLAIHNSFGLTDRRDRLAWNRSSGGAAINVAVHLGAKRIVLIGYDMDDDNRGPDGLLIKHTPGMINEFKPGVYKFQQGAMAKIQKAAKQRDVEILNASPGTAIKDFKKVRLEKVA